MAQNDSQPWNPDRSWADPFIAALLLVILVLIGSQARFRHTGPASPEDQATLEGRLQDVVLGAAARSPLKDWKLPGLALGPLAAGQRSGWDQALLAVHAGEAGDLGTGSALIQAAPGAAGAAFRQAWTWCYRGSGSPPSDAAFQPVPKALGGGYAARILEARMRARAGGDPRPLEAQAQAWATARLVALGTMGLAAVLVVIGGLGYGLYLLLNPWHAAPLPHYGLSGRAVLIVLLGWFLTLMTAGPLVAALAGPLPWIKSIYLPLVYSCHALAGTAYLALAEGVRPAALWRRVAPGRFGAALAAGLGYFALAFAAVLAVSLMVSPLLPSSESPQKALLDLLAHVHGVWAVTLLFLTVAVLAPAFEELMFRGFLLPWLVERLQARLGAKPGRLLAIACTGLGFAAMHMQPLGLPTLTTLGVVLGFAFLRTGNLATSILVHGLWNGGVFILMRIFS